MKKKFIFQLLLSFALCSSIAASSFPKDESLKPSVSIGGTYAAPLDRVLKKQDQFLQGYIKDINLMGFYPIQNSRWQAIVRGTLDVNNHVFEKTHDQLGTFKIRNKDIYTLATGLGYTFQNNVTPYAMVGIKQRLSTVSKEVEFVEKEEKLRRPGVHGNIYHIKTDQITTEKRTFSTQSKQIHPFLEAGLNYRPHPHFSVGAGLQYTFFKENKNTKFLRKTNHNTTFLIALSYHFF
jgi:opacity protein-like surface antigen